MENPWRPPYQKALLWLLLAALVASCIHPPYPREMYLQHFPTVAFLIALPWLSRRYPLEDGAFTCLIAFLLLHVLGASAQSGEDRIVSRRRHRGTKRWKEPRTGACGRRERKTSTT
jgi:hypothetical protein